MRLCFIALCGIVSISLNLLLYTLSASEAIFSHSLFPSLSFSLPFSLFLSFSFFLYLFLLHFFFISVAFLFISFVFFQSLPLSASPPRLLILHCRHRQFQKFFLNYSDRLHFLGCTAQPFPQCT